MSSSRFQTPLLSVTNVKPRLLVIGGQFSGTFVCRELRRDFEITLVDAKEFMEFTPGILRAFVRPSHFDSLSFTLQPVMEKMGVKFVAGEVKKLSFEDGEVLAAVKVLDPGNGTEVDSEGMTLLKFEYCVICSGSPAGEMRSDAEGKGAQSPLVRALLHVKWASLLQKAGKYDRAEERSQKLEHFGHSLALLPSARAHFGRGTCLAALRRRSEAQEELQKAVAMCPKMTGAIINLAGVQLGLGRFDEAERNCREALRLEPESREAVMTPGGTNLANALRNLRRRTEAVDLVWRHIGEVVETIDVAKVAEEWEVKVEKLVIACLKWGHRYNADYVNRLCASVRRHLPSAQLAEAKFVCFTEDPKGIDEFIETRRPTLPDGFHLWWGKAVLFSAEAGLDGHRVLFLDLDQVIVGTLEPLLAYQGPFAVLHTDDIACELAPGGYNSSVISWRGGAEFRPLFEALTPAVLRDMAPVDAVDADGYVHRFDHWLEMMLGTTADLWQQLAPGAVVDYTTVFRGGRCLGCDDDDGAFAAGDEDGGATAEEVALPVMAAVVTFPRSNFGPFSKWGESLWFPTIHEAARKDSEWPDIDERYLEGRRRHILEEHEKLAALNARRAAVLVVGAGFIGVEWVTELQHFFPQLQLTIVDVLPRCLGPLPERAAKYCERYMNRVGIKQVYDIKYDPVNQTFWDQVGLPAKAEKTFVCIGVKASNYFMPPETLSVRGPGGGGWIHFNQKLQVTQRPRGNEPIGELWAEGRVFAVGDCNYGCIGNPPDWIMAPVPKISFPSEEQAAHACSNLRTMISGNPKELKDTYWPWGAGMFATSLGPRDACFVAGANHQKGSGYMVNWWFPAAWQKELIERTKIMECRDNTIGRAVWHFVHHRPFLQ
eukprot:s3282_g3.t1